MAVADLKELRDQLDGLDAELVELLARRMEFASAVGQAKAAAGLTPAAYHDHAREAEVIRTAIERAGDRLPATLIARLFREIMAEALARQRGRQLTVCHLGPAGTFSEEAARDRFGPAAALRPLPTISDCFAAVNDGKADCAIVPYNDPADGSIGETLKGLVAVATATVNNVVVIGECRKRIVPVLMVPPGTRVEDITEYHCHPASYAQCMHWLRANLPPDARRVVSASNGAAARTAKDTGTAAVGSRRGAELCGLEIAHDGIADRMANNVTTFLVLGREPVAHTKDDRTRYRTTLLASTAHQPGALFKLLRHFDDAGIDMTKLLSRPTPDGKQDNFHFFIDVVGHRDAAPLNDVLAEMAGQVAVLGSYPMDAAKG